MKLLHAAFLFLLAVPALAQQPALDPALGLTTIPLYQGTPPHSAPTATDIPTLTVFPPQPGTANGTAVIVAPGGAYIGLAAIIEGRQVADWLSAHGITAFVLKYRLGPNNLYPIPLEDAQRAIRLVRSLATTYKLAPNRIGIIGFSAGGHLAAATGTLFDQPNAAASDPTDQLDDRPDFMILGYPWLNAMQPKIHGMINYCGFMSALKPVDCKALDEKYTPARHVSAKTPTTFIVSSTDDSVVPISTSIEFYSALLAAGVPAELHIFRHGSHGFGLGRGDAALDQWPALLEQWLRDQGLLTPAKITP